MKNHTTNTISQNIKKYRLLNHMTQEQLAEQLELDTQYYAQLIRRIIPLLEGLSYSQLSIVEKFVTELIPYIK